MKRFVWPYSHTVIAIIVIAHFAMTISHYGNLYTKIIPDAVVSTGTREEGSVNAQAYAARKNVQVATSLVYVNFAADLLIVGVLFAFAISGRNDSEKLKETNHEN